MRVLVMRLLPLLMVLLLTLRMLWCGRACGLHWLTGSRSPLNSARTVPPRSPPLPRVRPFGDKDYLSHLLLSEYVRYSCTVITHLRTLSITTS